MLSIAPCSITVAHGFGRVGCFFAGCCYGIETGTKLDMAFPIWNSNWEVVGHEYQLPTQFYDTGSVYSELIYSEFEMDINEGVPLEHEMLNTAYAGVWGQNITEQEIRNRVKSDPHALGEWRVNGALPHIDMWYEAFGVKEGDKMFIPKEQRLDLW